ncbi:MAG: hypothetical protein H8E66_11970 [Planctomycetes bacterium]|nr:hypothetical protein [Planctomycetota bacterium]MBL7043252.1 hypothetical protein [Pirellulaceae bacterium]
MRITSIITLPSDINTLSAQKGLTMPDYPEPYNKDAALSDANSIIVEGRTAAIEAMVKTPLSSSSKVGYVSVKSELGTERIANLVNTYEIPVLRAGAEAFIAALSRHAIHGTIEVVLD